MHILLSLSYPFSCNICNTNCRALHHCIEGSIEMLTAMLTGNKINIYHYIHFISFAVPGNIIGGAVFVAALKISHNKKEDMVEK